MSNKNATTGDLTGDENLENKPEGQNEEKKYTESDMQTMIQSEADRRVNQALETFKKNDLPGLIRAAKTEAEKLAKLSEREKEELHFSNRMKEIEQREKAAEQKELKITAHQILCDKGLPIDFLEVLNYSGAEEVDKSINALETAFRIAVEKEVNSKLKGSPPKKGDENTTSNNEELVKSIFGIKS